MYRITAYHFPDECSSVSLPFSNGKCNLSWENTARVSKHVRNLCLVVLLRDFQFGRQVDTPFSIGWDFLL